DVRKALAGDTLIQLADVQSKLAGPLVDVSCAERGGTGKQTVMHFPELALLGSAVDRPRRRHCALMKGQWHVAMEVLELTGRDVAGPDLWVHLALETPAEGALEVGVFDNGQSCRGLAFEELTRHVHGRGRREGRLPRSAHQLLQLIQAGEYLLLLHGQPCHFLLQ